MLGIIKDAKSIYKGKLSFFVGTECNNIYIEVPKKQAIGLYNEYNVKLDTNYIYKGQLYLHMQGKKDKTMIKLIKDYEKFDGTCLQGEIDISYNKLKKILGKHNSNGDKYKVSTYETSNNIAVFCGRNIVTYVSINILIFNSIKCFTSFGDMLGV